MRAPSSETRLFVPRSGERGSALVLFSLMTALVIIPMIGFAIDGGMAYFAHSRLVSAADAAALAAGRSFNVGLEFSAQKAHAEQVAQDYFNANFPNGMMGAENVSVKADAEQAANNTLTVAVNVSADIPTNFINILGYQKLTLNASAGTSRKDINIVLTLDRSGSMAGVCGTLRADAENFAAKFVNGRDTMGLVTFMGSASTDFASTKSFLSSSPSIVDTLKQLACANTTGSAAALSLAIAQLAAVNEPGAQNIIVFFTDGVPNGFTSGGPVPSIYTTGSTGFAVKPGAGCNSGNPIAGSIAEGGGLYSADPVAISSTSAAGVPGLPCFKTTTSFANLAKYLIGIPPVDAFGNSSFGDPLYGTNYQAVGTDASSNITFSDTNSDAVSKNAALGAALRARQAGIFIYVIGLGSNGGVDGTLLKRIANDTTSDKYNPAQPAGRYYYSPDAGQLSAAFNSIASEILRIAQ